MMHPMSDQSDDLNCQTRDLLSQAKAGDQAAMADLYRLYAERLQGAVKMRLGRRLRDRMESVDLVQSVWKDVLGDMDGFEYRGPDSFFRWLLTRLVHKIQDKGRYFASGKRDIGRETRLVNDDSVTPGAPPPPSDDPTPSEAAMQDEDLDRFIRLLDRIPDPQRKALVLRMRDEMTFEQIGKIMNKSAEAVRKLYSRGLMRISDFILDERNKEKEED